MNKIKKLFLFFVICFSSLAFAQNSSRDVPYTKELLTFIDSYFNNDFSSKSQAEQLYREAKNSKPATFSEYQRLTHDARCDYYFGMYVIEKMDLTQAEKAIDEKSNKGQDANKEIKAEGSKYFDQSINNANSAIAIKGDEASDAYSICAQSISGNLTIKGMNYFLSNGPKIAKYGKKAIAAEPKNGTAYISVSAQAVYAPGAFGNAEKGRKEMLSYLNDSQMICEKFDKFNYTIAVAYTYYRQKDYAQAKSWYQKCLNIYPKNYIARDMIKKCNVELGL